MTHLDNEQEIVEFGSMTGMIYESQMDRYEMEPISVEELEKNKYGQEHSNILSNEKFKGYAAIPMSIMKKKINRLVIPGEIVSVVVVTGETRSICKCFSFKHKQFLREK